MAETKTYAYGELVRLAKRQNNPKRSYLLINPLQAKHLPVSPGSAVDMMRALGDRIGRQAAGRTLLIAFAETATAIGAVAAKALGDDTLFIATTREELPAGSPLYFREEHSHAIEQKIFRPFLDEYFPQAETVVMLDDEFSTGRTLANMAAVLRERYPFLREKKLLAASVINRLTEEQEQMLADLGLKTVALLRPGSEDLTSKVSGVVTGNAASPPARKFSLELKRQGASLANPRLGVEIGPYVDALTKICRRFIHRWGGDLASAQKILALGSEECMFPAIWLGRALEREFPAVKVFTHATTRSPIGIAKDCAYPIVEGYSLPGLYDEKRQSFIYNPAAYDAVILVTDALGASVAALESLLNVFASKGEAKFFLLQLED